MTKLRKVRRKQWLRYLDRACDLERRGSDIWANWPKAWWRWRT